jgi:hypothetical protein
VENVLIYLMIEAQFGYGSTGDARDILKMIPEGRNMDT